ncbi:MAG: hypothetical protein H6741_32350 [Alphaproteobacteria bacterium]|nr:hypothetical protein [Alphaproteobacteria bacterium]
MAERAPGLPPGTVMLKPLPKGARSWPQGALSTVSGFVVQAAQVEGLSAAQTIRALRLTHHYLHPSTGERVSPYLGEGGEPLDELLLLRFPLTEGMSPKCLVPTGVELLQAMTEAQRMAVPYVGMSVAKGADGRPLPGDPFTGSGVLAGPPIVQELFLVGRHPLPPGAELIVRR